MIFQIGDILLAGLILDFVLWILIFLLGVLATRRYAEKKSWDDTLKTALEVNLVWFLIGISIGILTTFIMPEADWLSSILGGILNIIIGVIIVKKFYDKEFNESLKFVIIIQLILLLIAIILGYVLAALIAMIIVSLSA